MKHPRILLLDEPFGALDPRTRLGMHGLITRLWRERGLTILMVTHDIPEAFKLSTRVLVLDKQRHDPQAAHRFGSTAIADIPLSGLTAALRKAAIPAAMLADPLEIDTAYATWRPGFTRPRRPCPFRAHGAGGGGRRW